MGVPTFGSGMSQTFRRQRLRFIYNLLLSYTGNHLNVKPGVPTDLPLPSIQKRATPNSYNPVCPSVYKSDQDKRANGILRKRNIENLAKTQRGIERRGDVM